MQIVVFNKNVACRIAIQLSDSPLIYATHFLFVLVVRSAVSLRGDGVVRASERGGTSVERRLGECKLRIT